MRGILVLALGWSLAASASTFDPAADFLCESVVGAKVYQYADHFETGFTKAIPEATFRSIVDELKEASGDCTRKQLVAETATAASYDLFSAPGHRLRVILQTSADGKISGLRFSEIDLNVALKNFDDVRKYLGSWRGTASATLSVFGQTPESARGNERQPLGSGFKLYILGALEAAVKAGKLKWSDKLAVRDDWKSLPSGDMQNLPEGTEVDLRGYAEKMISISDNTATDHLLWHLGRLNVEAQLKVMGNPFPSANLPFLSTAEMFKLKWAVAPAVAQNYVDALEVDRRQILHANIGLVPLSKVGTNGVGFDKPVRIRDIEWFGSTEGQCAALENLHGRGSREVESILSINQPLIDPGKFKYAGYKGGSEPGVMTMAYLLQGPQGKWGCFSVAWHDEAQGVNQWILLDFARKGLALAEKAL